MSHFVLTEETRIVFGVTLYRIKATKDLPQHEVSEGDLGGWVEKKENLSGDSWVSDNARVYGNAWVSDNYGITKN